MLTLPSAQWIPSQYTWAKLTIAWREQVVYIVIKPHKAVKLICIARWLRTILKEAGIDSFIVGGHFTRGVSASASARGGVTLEEILKEANWSSESVFQRFCHKEVDQVAYRRAVINQNSLEGATNNTVDV